MSDIIKEIASLPPEPRELIEGLLEKIEKKEAFQLSEVAGRIVKLPPEQRELVKSVLKRAMSAGNDGGGRPSPPPLVALPRKEGVNVLPVSFAQQRLWLLDQIAPGDPAYNQPYGVLLKADIDAATLEKAIGEVVRRHESLRTTFSAVDGQPVQVISPSQTFKLSQRDLRGLAPQEREAEARRLAVEEGRRPFDLKQGPLLRGLLLRVGEQEHILVVTLHHIVFDGLSLIAMVREIGALYVAIRLGQPSPLPELRIQYADFAVWQREWLSGETLETHLAYWRRQLGGELPVLKLPSFKPQPAVQGSAGATYPVRLSPELTKSLRELSWRTDVSLYMTLLAAFNVLLYRYTGQEDIVVGSPIAGHTRAELEGLIGFFVNTLVLRTDLSGEPSFRELLGRVREVCLGAYAHQDVPFERLVEELQPERNKGRTPLFQVLLGLFNPQRQLLQASGLTVEVIDVNIGTSKFDLSLYLYDQPDEVTGFIEYSTDVLDEAAVERLAENFDVLLRAAVADPDLPISELPLLTEAERRQELDEWNRTGREYPKDKCVHHLFEEQAQRTPGSVAAVFESRELTYGELNRRANQLAHHLLAAGVGPGALVGLRVERSLEMLVAMLGILKAGAGYVPLDPAYPQERLDFVIRDSDLRLLLTRQQLAQGLPPHASAIYLDAELGEIEERPAEDPRLRLDPRQTAYVIYTSGSTGKPKGVVVSHRNVVNFFAAMDERVGCGPADTMLALTSISFDISVLELLWTLARGARVVLVGETGAAAAARPAPRPARSKGMEYSLFYFATGGAGREDDPYRLLMEGARFADRNGFTAVWTPERHFHPFGGLYPNPSVTGAALAAVTERVQIRAGSVVLPLHNTLRVAEEWALVDNLSKGRVGVAFASGWHTDDFALRPENYAECKEIMYQEIQTVQRLWRGEAVRVRGGTGKEVELRIYPRPVQPQLPVWITAAGNVETFARAGEVGANLLTHLLGQSVEELAEKIACYRAARERHGHDPQAGHVTLMLHTFLGEDRDEVRRRVREPFTNYLRSSVGLVTNFARGIGMSLNLETVSRQDMDTLLAYAFDRYFETSALFGTPKSCEALVERLAEIGVDEIGCLIDFGVSADDALDGLRHLRTLKEATGGPREWHDYSPAAQAARYGATLMQCTPSQMRLLMHDPEAPAALRPLRALLFGGEALPPALAAQVKESLPCRLLNMYGPTETTVWSAAHEVREVGGSVPIGRPVANTQIYLLDAHGQPVPVGVAGELYIGGEGLADGYWKRPSLTAERFIPDPFSAEPGARLYRTGDLARYLPSGEIEFLGRTDHQVKLRGYRIELGEVESALKSHPRVRAAVVTLHELHDEPQLLAYVIPRRDDPEREQARASYLSEWQHVYDDAYHQSTAPDPDFDTSGWNSSYTGEPIPADEMRPWVEQTVSALRALNPSDVLEVGCGTGLLLTRLAPGCRSYLGLDFSPTVLARLGSHLSARADLSHVRLRQAAAHELSFLEDDSVDLVVLNSVVQYFPDVDYLLDVLSQALHVTRPGGHIFIGDVRSLSLLGAFHTSVQLHKAAAETPLAELRQRVAQAQRHEKELVVDSALFTELGRRWGKAGRVTCRLKEGGYDNEVSRFRYDVTLAVGPKEEAEEPERWVEWDEGGSWREALGEELGERAGASVGVKGIRDGRAAAEVEAARLLHSPGEEVPTAGELAALSAAAKGEDPEEVARVARRHGAEFCWKGFGAEGVYDAIFNPRWGVGRAEAESPRSFFRKFTNEPAPSAGDAEFGRELRQHVRERLPEYMIPAEVLVLAEWPLTPNGKLDRKALPAPGRGESAGRDYVAPQTETARTLAEIWGDVLGVERVGENDNFFELGGHSLLAPKIIARVQDALGIEIPMRVMLASPTVGGMARAIDAFRAGGDGAALAEAGVPDLEAEANLEPEIYPAGGDAESVTSPRNILLTGATGFLGAFLLRDLLRQTTARVFCLVRASDREAGLRKLRVALTNYELWDEGQSSRIEPVLGDLARPLLGLPPDRFQELSDKIDLIYHNGAFVNFSYPYAELKGANVLGTKEVLKLACRGRAKPLHYISTVSIFSMRDAEESLLGEEVEPRHYEDLTMGYSQSKWVAERLVKIAASRGLPVSIYRPGTITGDSRTGISNLDDFTCRYIKGCVELGQVPNLDEEMNIVPVDYVSGAVVHLSLRKESAGKIFHLVNPRPLGGGDQFAQWFTFLEEYGVRQVPYEQWRKALEGAPDNPLYTLLPTIPEWQGEEELMMQGRVMKRVRMRYECRNTLEMLAGTPISCPPVDAQLLGTYLSFFVRCGFLPQP